MKVTICGGGNIAHALAGMLGNNKSLDLHVLTRKPELWANHLMVELEGNTFFSITGTVTSSFSTAIENSDLILLALPAFARKEVIEKIAPFVKQGAWIGAFPGMGNFDLIVSECFKNSDKKEITRNMLLYDTICFFGDDKIKKLFNSHFKYDFKFVII